MEHYSISYWEWRTIPWNIVLETYEVWQAATHADNDRRQEEQRRREAESKARGNQRR